jgi:hypothetical protein
LVDLATARLDCWKGRMGLGCRIVARAGSGGHTVLVFNRRNELHFPLTVFAGEATKRTRSGTARQYVNVLIPFFDWLEIEQSSRICFPIGKIILPVTPTYALSDSIGGKIMV